MLNNAIAEQWKQRQFSPVYWLEGEEPFFLNQLIQLAESGILSPSEASFDQTVLYGNETNVEDLINKCLQYPLVATKQVVIVKEAQHLKRVEQLKTYIESPAQHTILILCFIDKLIDKRTVFGKLVHQKTVYFNAKPLYDNMLPPCVVSIAQAQKRTISPQAVQLILSHTGNDLEQIASSIHKIAANHPIHQTITEQAVEQYVGISKEYNLFELQNAIGVKNLKAILPMIAYFDKNPKAAPAPLLLSTLYSFFSKLYVLHSLPNTVESTMASALSVHPYFVKDYLKAAKLYSFAQTEQIISLLYQYNRKQLGLEESNSSGAAEWMRELCIKILTVE